MGTEILRRIQNHCCQSRSCIGPIGGKADVRQKCFPIITLAAGLHHSAKKLLGCLLYGDVCQRGKVTLNDSSWKLPIRNAQHSMRRLVGHQHTAIRIRRKDGDRAAVNEDLQLFFRFAARISLPLDFMKVLLRYPAVADHLTNEGTCSNKGGEEEHIPGDAGSQVPGQIAEHFRQEGAKGGDGANLPAAQNASNHQHGNQIEEAERNLRNHQPVQKRNGRNYGSCFEQNRSPGSLEENSVHEHLLRRAGEAGAAT